MLSPRQRLHSIEKGALLMFEYLQKVKSITDQLSVHILMIFMHVFSKDFLLTIVHLHRLCVLDLVRFRLRNFMLCWLRKKYVFLMNIQSIRLLLFLPHAKTMVSSRSLFLLIIPGDWTPTDLLQVRHLPMIQCQIFHKYSHPTIDCFQRLNLKILGHQPAERLTTMFAHKYDDSNESFWYADIGTSHHATAEFDNLSMSE